MTEEKSRDADFNELIKDMFHAEEWKERAEAVRTLGFMQDGRAVNLMVKALKKEEEFNVINRLIEALGRIGNPKATRAILEKLMLEQGKDHPNKYRIIAIIESLIGIKDKRALAYIGQFLTSEDGEIRELTKQAFDTIEPNWRKILEKEQKKKSLEEIFGKL
ncbi:MAG: PBS lyase HEAT-like repeat protein [Promethearchaeota archaeon]|jgi:HEAT repeat protein|nr:MAG: PBS lyase HEAT-like repeat protein [Candidatus Lokiarchaeota archaeon]